MCTVFFFYDYFYVFFSSCSYLMVDPDNDIIPILIFDGKEEKVEIVPK